MSSAKNFERLKKNFNKNDASDPYELIE